MKSDITQNIQSSNVYAHQDRIEEEKVNIKHF